MSEHLTKHIDNAKELAGTTGLATILLEKLEDTDEHFWEQPRTVVNLFAGNMSESYIFCEYFAKHQLTSRCVAVDKEPPQADWQVTMPVELQPEVITDDVLHYLRSQPDGSLDIITAYGTEYYFIKGMIDTIEFKELVTQKLKAGGYIHWPASGVSTHFPSTQFEKVGRQALYKKR